MSDVDKKKFVAIFKAEADERVSKLERGLLELEKNPKDIEIIKDMNREAHSIKGAARMLGFEKIEQVSHHIEDTFASISRGEKEFTSEIADDVFSNLDAIKQQIASELGTETKGETEDQLLAQTMKRLSAQKMEYVRIPLPRVDKLMNLTGEMVVNKVKSSYKLDALKKINRLLTDHLKMLAYLKGKLESSVSYQLELDAEKLFSEIRQLSESVSVEALHLEPLVDELEDEVRNLRMLPASTIFDAYHRLVRDLAKAQEKQIEFEIIGGDTEIDKKILEEINPALIHVLRNSVDHGIEQSGSIKLSAWHEGGNVVIQVRDDGAGIDIEKIKETALSRGILKPEELDQMSGKEIIDLIFMPGFSTSSVITDISGRGVGMDVVKTQVERLRGQVEIESIKGGGTSIAIILPLTVALLQALMVKVENQTFALPMLAVDEVVKILPPDINTVEGRSAIELRGHIMPLIALKEVLGLPSQKKLSEKTSEFIHVVVASSPGKKIGFIIDLVIGDAQIYIKTIGGQAGKIKNVEGATIMGTGEVVIVLDVQDLVENAKSSRHEAILTKEESGQKTKKILVVEDALTTRELERSILENQGYQVSSAIDGIDGLEKVYQDKPDLIIADINMPRLDGFEMCKTLKKDERNKNIPVIIVTAREKEEDMRRGIEAGADAYIIKNTFDQQNLLETIERLIG